jgi:hypothetical protein
LSVSFILLFVDLTAILVGMHQFHAQIRTVPRIGIGASLSKTNKYNLNIQAK